MMEDEFAVDRVPPEVFAELARVSELFRDRGVFTGLFAPADVRVGAAPKQPMFVPLTPRPQLTQQQQEQKRQQQQQQQAARLKANKAQAGLQTVLSRRFVVSSSSSESDESGGFVLDGNVNVRPAASDEEIYIPGEADARLGSMRGKGAAEGRARAWFRSLSSSYHKGFGFVKPLLVLIGPSGSGKSFLLHWMCLAHDVRITSVDPLECGGLSSRFAATTPLKKRKKKKQPVSKAVEEEVAKETGGGGSTVLRDLALPDWRERPRLLHVQDMRLCTTAFVRHLLQLTKALAKVPRAAALVLELSPGEAYGAFQQYSPLAGAPKSSLAGFLDKFAYATVIRLYPARQRDLIAHAYAYRARLSLPTLPASADTPFLRRLADAARGDFRQIEILLRWHAIPTNALSTSTTVSTKPNPAAVLLLTLVSALRPAGILTPIISIIYEYLPTGSPNEIIKWAVWADDDAVSALDARSGDLSVGLQLLRLAGPQARPTFGNAEDVVDAFGFAPATRVAAFFVSWIEHCCKEGKEGELVLGEAGALAVHSGDTLYELLRRGLQLGERAAALSAGSFQGFQLVRRLNAATTLQVFGRFRAFSVEQASLRAQLLSAYEARLVYPDSKEIKKVGTSPGNNTSSGSVVGNNTSSGSVVGNNTKIRKHAVTRITLNSAGGFQFGDFDAAIPQPPHKRQRLPTASLAKPVKPEPVVLKVVPRSRAVLARDVAGLRAIAGVLDAASAADSQLSRRGFVRRGGRGADQLELLPSSLAVAAAVSCVRRSEPVLGLDTAQPWRLVSRWLHPFRRSNDLTSP